MSLNLPETVALRKETERPVWSARLSTGLFGLPSCESGNRGPKGWSEVVLALGDTGLNSLIRLGFIPCPTCKPDKKDGFWQVAKDSILKNYDLDHVEDFADKTKVTYDVRRVDWETLLPLLGRTPNRLYLPQNLSQEDLIQLRDRFKQLGFNLPPSGYYDKDAPGRFREYEIPSNLVK